MKTILCPVCDEYTDVILSTEIETYRVRGEPVEIEAEIAICQKCNEKVFDEERDSRNLEKVYAEYRKKHGLLTPKEITAIREKYGMSQRSLSRLLGWGDITLHRYENGAIQDAAHNNLLLVIKKPENLHMLFEARKADLPQSVSNHLERLIRHLLAEQAESLFEVCFTQRVSHQDISLNTGFREYDLDKFTNMLLYLLTRQGGILKTKLNKLAWYADFLHFKEESISITGSRYVHYNLGPVPEHYDLILSKMMEDGLVEVSEIVFDAKKDIVGERYVALAKPDVEVFSERELQVLARIADVFRTCSSGQIKRKSHQEDGFKKTRNNEYISYEYAKELSISFHN